MTNSLKLFAEQWLPTIVSLSFGIFLGINLSWLGLLLVFVFYMTSTLVLAKIVEWADLGDRSHFAILLWLLIGGATVSISIITGIIAWIFN